LKNESQGFGERFREYRLLPLLLSEQDLMNSVCARVALARYVATMYFVRDGFYIVVRPTFTLRFRVLTRLVRYGLIHLRFSLCACFR